MADFIKNALEKQELNGLENKAESLLGGNSNSGSNSNAGSNENKDSNSNDKKDSNNNNNNNANSNAENKYGSYVTKGVEYAEKNVFNIDTNNMTESQKATQSKVESFINKEINEYTSKN